MTRRLEPLLVPLLAASLASSLLLPCGCVVGQQRDAAAPGRRISTDLRGPTLEFDLPGVEVGIAEYPDGPTGTTVFWFPEPVQAAIDVRGGAPGVIGAEPLRLQQDAAFTNAVVFAGGSSYGLSASTGVAEAVQRRWQQDGQWRKVADVVGAIIYDIGARRLNAVMPDGRLGAAAFGATRRGVFPLGAQGAGSFAMQGWFYGHPRHSGQGGAFRRQGETRVAVFTVVNALGAVVDRSGKTVGMEPNAPYANHAELVDAAIEAKWSRAPTQPKGGTTGNTTLTLVVTNERLSALQLKRLAIQVHTSMGRAIHPFSTESDGDVLVAVTTGAVATPGLSPMALGVLASEVAWDAVLASVPQKPAPLPIEPCAWTDAQLDEVVGEYRFSPWFEIRVRRDGGRLVVDAPQQPSLYFPSGGRVELLPVGDDLLRTDRDNTYHLRIERDAEGDVDALVLEPGPWAQRAARVR